MKKKIKLLRNYILLFLLNVIIFIGLDPIISSNHSMVSSQNFQATLPLDDTLITVLSPNGGEIWEPGTTEFIKWTSSNVSFVLIEYSTDYGNSWFNVYSSVPAYEDSVSWVLPNTPSHQCLIKIVDVNNNLISDTSNSVFMISSGGWVVQNSGTGQDLTSIHFVNNNLGWCVGDHGIILNTTNGGIDWISQYNNPGLWLISTHFINENRGLVVGNNGLVLLTTDGGNSWEQVTANPVNKLNAVQFANDSIAWILGDDGLIFKTTDGGSNWNFIPYNGNVDWYSLSFIDTANGWIVGRHGAISKTTDGGQSWIDQISNTSHTLYSVDFVDEFYGWIAGYNGTILHTTNGGINWSFQQGGTTTWLQTIEFVNRDSGWIGGWYNKMLKTRNGGDFWSTQPIPPIGGFGIVYAICFPSEEYGWACGQGGAILKYSAGVSGITVTRPNGGELILAGSIYNIRWLSIGVNKVKIEYSVDNGFNWEVITDSVTANDPPFLWQVPEILSNECLIKISDVDNANLSDISNEVFTIIDGGWFQQEISTGNNLNSIYFTNEESGWIAGSGGTIFTTSDSGQTWLAQQSGTSVNLNSIHFANPQSGWAVGESGTILKTTNSGSNWLIQSSGTYQDLNSVFFISTEVGWVSGNNGVIMKSVDGGQNWNFQSTPGSDIFYSIYFVNADTGVAVGTGGFILFTSNGGDTWEYAYGSYAEHLYSIHFADDFVGYASGTLGRIHRSINSGQSWNILTELNSYNLFSIHFIHPSTGWTIGQEGIIFKTSNFGNSWFYHSSGVSVILESVFFTHPNIGWAVGESGTVLKYTPSRPENVTVLFPNGGENWQHGSTYSITWISTDVENVKIEYSIDDGYSWINIVQSVPASDQSYQWLIPNTPTLNGRVKLSDVSDETIFDISDTTFAISSEEHGWFKLPISTGYRFSSVHFESENLGWVVGNYGNILNTTDGGYNWVNQNSGTYDYLTTVEFIDNNIGWTVGLSGTILKTINAGSNWFSQQGTITSSLESASFIDANNGWVLSYYGKIFHTSNGGNDWYEQYQLPNGYFYNIEFVNSLKGWVSGNLTPWNESVIFKTTDGGETWEYSYLNLSTPGVKCISFVDENYGFGVGIHGVIMRTTNGGASWIKLTEGFNNWLFSVHCVSQNLGWAVGQNGTILHTTDGTNWLNQISGTTEGFNSIYMVNSSVGYIVTQNGNIFKTNSGGVIPVELTKFSAFVDNNKVTLQWSTATETNNYGFNIERSQKMNKEENTDWKEIGFVPGFGTSTEKHDYSLIDENIMPGEYQYRLKQIDYDGNFEYSDIIEIEVLSPNEYSLEQNYPNPFNPTTTIAYSLKEKGLVSLKLFDILGKEINTLINEEQQAGVYKVNFDASSLSSGIYFYQLKAGTFVETKKMILLK